MSQRTFVKKAHAAKPRLTRQAAIARIGVLRGNIRSHNTQMRSSEKKNIDSTLAFPVVGAGTGILTLLNGSQAGGLPTNRVGRRMTMTSVFVRGSVALQAASTGNCPVRILVVYDKQSNKAAPNPGDILVGDRVDEQMLLANSHRFKVVRDILIPCLGTAGPQSALINEYAKVNLQTEYIDGAGAGTVADITSGSLYALVYCNNQIGGAACLSNVQVRVRFQDL